MLGQDDLGGYDMNEINEAIEESRQPDEELLDKEPED